MLLIERGFNPARIARNETLFHTANGYLGVRACLEEGVPQGIHSIRGTYLNAFYETKPMTYTERLYGFPQEQETLVNVPDAQTIRIAAGGEQVSLFEGNVLDYRQTLDMGRGITLRAWRVRTPAGHVFDVETRRMASFVEPSLFLMRCAVRAVNYDGPLTFTSSLDGDVRPYANPDDPRVAQTQEGERHLDVTVVDCEADGLSILCCGTLRSGLHMACGSRHILHKAHRAQGIRGPRSATQTFDCAIATGEEIVLEKWCAFADSRRCSDPRAKVEEVLRRAVEAGPWAAWERRQQDYLTDFWQVARVSVRGNEDPQGGDAQEDSLQNAADFAAYQLLQSTGQDGISGTAAKGLSGEGYEGHFFWDTEIYIFPFFMLTDPYRAKKLLDYRHGLLDAARAHARSLGHEVGALYPWRTIAGRECSGYYPSGSAQYHINGDVAHAFAQYWYVTKDLAYMEQAGGEVLIETARLWMDAGHMQGEEFCIDSVTGPDEYTCIVNNNYYTNASARENLRVAIQVYEALGAAGRLEMLEKATGVTPTEIESFRLAAERMRLPYDRERGIYAQDDAFLGKKILNLSALSRNHFPLLLHYHPLFLYRHQVCKQADAVLAHFLFEEGVDEEDMRRTYDYYEKITTHDSSLSPCVYAIMAARLGNLAKAMEYFIMTARMDLDDLHGNVADGIHTANLGGVYLVLVMGFAGLRITREGVALAPRLPIGMEGYAFSFAVAGSLVRLEVDAGGWRLSLVRGMPVVLKVNERDTRVAGKGDWEVS